MILVRSAGGTLCYLIRQTEEEASIGILARTYPGRSIEVLERKAGLLIACVGAPPGDVAAGSRRRPTLSIVDFRLGEADPGRRASLA